MRLPALPPAGPPSSRRGITKGLLIAALVAAFAALAYGAADALVAFLIFGAVNVAFCLGWHGWNRRQLRFSFGAFWAAALVAGAIVFGIVIAARSGLGHAAIALAPVVVLLTLWLVLRYVFGLRER